MAELVTQKRVRVDPESPELDSPQVKRLTDDLPSNLDESDLYGTSSDLDSFMRSLAKEISAPVVDLTSYSGESRPGLGHLQEASDDDLGIPSAVDERVQTEFEAGLSEFWWFEDESRSYDYFKYGQGYEYDDLGFDYSDLGLDLYEATSPLWLTETSPAL